MKTIPLTQGKVALVDDEDYEALAAHKWCAHKNRSGRFYATRSKPRGTGVRGVIRMHAVVARTPAGMDTDHVDGDSLNNRRENLRVCTRAENMANRGKNKNNTSGFKGVFRFAQNRKSPWVAQIQKGGQSTYLGYFPTAEAAARAYDEAARSLHGEFAVLNFPPE